MLRYIRYNRWKSQLIFLLVVVAEAGSLSAQGVSLRIETETAVTQFRTGEAIGLTLTFETSSPDIWMVTITGRDRSVLGLERDGFPTSPVEGTSDPLRYRFGEPIAYSGPGGMFLHEKTTVAHVDLNQWVRFERPGYYRVHAVFHARPAPPRSVNQSDVNQEVTLDSNEIGIEIVAADAEWQKRQLREDVAVLNTVPLKPDNQTFQTRMDAARRIWYLDTPDSVREAGQLLGTADVQVGQILQAGLQSSGRRDEAVAAMKQLLRSPDQPVTPGFLETLAALEARQHFPQSGLDAQRRYEARAGIAGQLRSELAEVVEQKRGAAKAISMKTLLDNMLPEVAPAALRSEIAHLFLELPSGQQSELLGSQWKKIAGPEMIPVLQKIYDAAPETAGLARPIVAAAVERLYELDPVHGRALLLDEMRRPVPRLPFDTLAILPDATLPEMDQLLAEHLEHNAGTEELIARYATPGILERVKAFYAKRDAMMRARTSANVPNIASPACEQPLVAYFLRADPAWGERVLRELLAERSYPGGRCWMGILGQTASYYVSPEWEKVAVLALQDQTVTVKADAVKALGKHGSAASETAVWDAFRYWHGWWKDKPAEMNEENRRFEQVFLESIAHAKNWNITPGDLEKIRDLCITQDCSGRAEEYRREWK
jgi:hypothetical protein